MRVRQSLVGRLGAALFSGVMGFSGLIGLMSPIGVVFAQQAPQPELPRIPLSMGVHLVQAEVANTYPTRMVGLMARKTMAQNHGMLFVFPAVEQQCMWMRNTLLPLSVAFIDEKGIVTNIEDMEPQTETSHCAQRPVRFALEMNKGWFAARGIRAGAFIGGLDKAPGPR